MPLVPSLFLIIKLWVEYEPVSDDNKYCQHPYGVAVVSGVLCVSVCVIGM